VVVACGRRRGGSGVGRGWVFICRVRLGEERWANGPIDGPNGPNWLCRAVKIRPMTIF
jgi:hypothetical protein